MRQRNQEIRRQCLLELNGVRPLARSASHVRRKLCANGFDYSEREVFTELEFLIGQELAERVNDTVAGERLYKITSQGVIEFEQSEPG